MQTDYLIIGAGTTGLCFADQLLTSDPSATIAIVDRRGAPGGHWVDAYPFVELHQPASFYGAASRSLGTDVPEADGANAGLSPLASGAEVRHHFERVLAERLLPSGRVRYLPLHEVTAEGEVRSLLSGRRSPVEVARRTVDARYYENSIPRTHTRGFAVADGVTIVPPNDLPQAAPHHRAFVVLGGGKTGIDAVLFLLRMGADPDQITWVVPRDPWLWARETTQPHRSAFAATIGAFASQMEAAAEASDPADFALRMEGAGVWRRVDPSVTPSMFHAATCSRAEVEALRSLRRVIRAGRVRSAEPGRLVLDGGEAAVPADALLIDCTASAIAKRPTTPIFAGDTITCQMVRFPAVSLSAALLAHIEASLPNDDERNRFAAPVPLPDTVEDYMTTLLVGMMNQGQWRQSETISAFLAQTRLEPAPRLMREGHDGSAAHAEIMDRIQRNVLPAMTNLARLAA